MPSHFKKMEDRYIVKVVLISNYFNHHQKPFCDAMYQYIGYDFVFVTTSEMREERKQMGYGMSEIPSYVVESKDSSVNLGFIDEADVVIFGSAPEQMIKNRVRNKKIVFRYSERPLKKGNNLIKYFPRLFMWHRSNPMRAPIYLLCASAYTAVDYSNFGLFKNKTYQWGYFPQFRKHDILTLMQKKKSNQILWCGRLIDWKHPDDVIQIARRLKEEGYDFSVTLIGLGIMEQPLRKMIDRYGLQNEVLLPGAMEPEQVRNRMENAGIYLATSDYQEGWGAVVNEAMNSGCAVVASHAMGSVPFMVKHGENGLVYESGNIEMLYQHVKTLLTFPQQQVKLGTRAYYTIAEEWNAEIAAQRFLQMVNAIQEKGSCELYQDGPCAPAKVIKNDWVKKIDR